MNSSCTTLNHKCESDVALEIAKPWEESRESWWDAAQSSGAK